MNIHHLHNVWCGVWLNKDTVHLILEFDFQLNWRLTNMLGFLESELNNDFQDR